MTTFRTTDILVYNDKYSRSQFESNIGDPDARYRVLRDWILDDEESGMIYAGLIFVEDVTTGRKDSGFWWRLKVLDEEQPYDPTQMGDKEDDI